MLQEVDRTLSRKAPCSLLPELHNGESSWPSHRSAALFAAFIMFVRRPIRHLDLSPNEHVTTEAVQIKRSCTPCCISRNFEKYYDDISER